MESKLKSELQLRVREAGVITGFCYPYARLLLDKVIALEEEGVLLTEPDSCHCRYLTSTSEAIFHALAEQIPDLSVSPTMESCTKAIKVAKDFLAIFEE